MSFVQFVGRQRKGTWSVTSADLDRSFAARATALKAAVELANESGKNGKPAIVCAEGDGGQFEAIWILRDRPVSPYRPGASPKTQAGQPIAVTPFRPAAIRQ
jgi:hypothetical protein